MAREPQADFATGAGGRQRAREPRTERNARGMRESVGRVVSQRCAECSAASGERCQAWGGVLALAFAGVLGGRRTVCRRARYGQHGTAIRGFGGGRTVPETVAAAVNGSRRWSRKKKNGRQSECQERDQAAKALKAGPRDRAKRIGPREGDVSESESETRARRRGEMPWGETREIQLDKESRGERLWTGWQTTRTRWAKGESNKVAGNRCHGLRLRSMYGTYVVATCWWSG